MVCLALEFVGPWVVLGFSVGMEAFEHSFALPFFGIRMKTDLFQSCGHC